MHRVSYADESDAPFSANVKFGDTVGEKFVLSMADASMMRMQEAMNAVEDNLIYVGCRIK